jgi:hypothetical protein
MKAEIITYETKNLTNTQRSIISKRLFGFRDKTKKAKYVYQREGILTHIPHVVITKKTFVLESRYVKQVKNKIKKLGAEVKSWKISITYKELKKDMGKA